MLSVDLEHDSFHVDYDSRQVSVERMLDAVLEHGFQGRVVDPLPVPDEVAGAAHWSLDDLPEELQEPVDRARKEGRPLLLAFHGPG